mgnify:CR=1 FL=1
MSNRDLSDDPQLKASGFFVFLPHPEVGVRQHAGIPWRMSRTPTEVRSAAPCLGEHTDYVMREILAYTPEEISRLRDGGVLN